MPEKKKMLNIVIDSVFGEIKLAAFPNEHRKENKRAPHFKGNKVAVWVNEYEPKESKQKPEELKLE